VSSRPPDRAPRAARTEGEPLRRPHRGLAAATVAVAGAAVLAGTVVGVRGLLGNPVRSTAADGTSLLSGSFEPFDCGGCGAQGYVQNGARSVFVRLPAGCAAPARESHVEVRARPAPDLGAHAYRAVSCPAGR
jgi:hypothetical protein